MEMRKIPWLPTEHEITKDKSKIWDYWMFKEYRDLIDSGEQSVSTDIYDLFDYLEKVINELDIYLDITMTEDSYYKPKRFFPHDLFPWERFLLPIIFGLRYCENDQLVFDDYFIFMARGGGKNYFMSWVIFALTSKVNGIKKYNIAVSASSERQAKTSFLDIASVIEDNPVLNKAYTLTQKKMEHKGTKSEFIFLSSNGNTMDGQRLGLAYTDEVHAITDHNALNVMRTSLGKIPDQRSVITSTDGYVRGKVLDEYKELGKDILSGKKGVLFPIGDPRRSNTFPFMHHIDDLSEAKTIEGWQKANPTLIYNPNLLQSYYKEVALIDSNPEQNIEFHLKRLNWVKEDSRFAIATHSEIQATKVRDIFYYRDTLGLNQVYGAVDFSSSKDLTSVAIVGEVEDNFYLLQHSFITREQFESGMINKQFLEDNVARGQLTVVDDGIIPETCVSQWFIDRQNEGWLIQSVFIDQYKSGVLGTHLTNSGFDCVRIATNMLNETLISPIIDRAFSHKQIYAGDDKLFRWACGNIYKTIANKGVRFDKIEPLRRKTDPFSVFLTYLIGTVNIENPNNVSGFTGVVV